MVDAIKDQPTQGGATTVVGSDEPKVVSTDVERLKAIKDEAFKERDALKARLRELEAKAEDERKKEIERNQAYKQELEKVAPELERLKAFEAGYQERLSRKLADAESSIDPSIKSEYERFIKKLPAEERIEWIEARSASKPVSTDSPAPHRAGGSATPKSAKLSQLSAEERLKLARTDPEGFRRLLKG